MIRKTGLWLTLLSVMAALFLSGCSAGELLDMLTGTTQHEDQEALPASDQEPAQRVYMDEITGTLAGFDGEHIRLQQDEKAYDFEVISATIESASGILSGDEISVIYEGKLDGDDTSQIKALKVTDALHKKEQLREYTISGLLVDIGSASLTLALDDGRDLRLPVIGRPQYYSEGLKEGMQLYVHLVGEILEGQDAFGMPEGSHVTVLSVSDLDPFSIPAEDPLRAARAQQTPAPDRETASPDGNLPSRLRCSVENLSGQTLKVMPDQYDTPLVLDVSEIPFVLPEGCLEGAAIDIYYYGSFNGEDTKDMRIIQVRGVEASRLQMADIRSQVAGTVTGTTADTVSLVTPDQSLFTCRTHKARNRLTQPLLPGAQICVILDPSASIGTNIYSVISLEDG